MLKNKSHSRIKNGFCFLYFSTKETITAKTNINEKNLIINKRRADVLHA